MESAGSPKILSTLCTAVIFCGGRATRLQEYLHGQAKALVLLERRPYLHSLLLRLREAGLTEVVLCVSPFTLSIVDAVRGGREYGLNIRYSFDSGTRENADALWQARHQIHTPLAICINGDTIFDVDFNELIRLHLRHESIATLVASNRMDQPHPAGIEVALDGSVVDLHEWAQDHQIDVVQTPLSNTYANSGIYVFAARRLEKIWPREQRVGKIEQGLLRNLAAKKQLRVMNNGDRYLLDIGTPDRLMTARSQIGLISRVLPV